MLIFAKMTQQKKIIVSVTNDLCTDQRVHKVCTSLHENGYEVLLVGRRLKSSPQLGTRAYQTKRFSLLFHKGPLFYFNYNLSLFIYLLFKRFDILLANDLDSLMANYYASKVKSKYLVYDSHEYFTEVPELINRPKVQAIWKKIEARILPKVKNCYTVGKKIAEVYNQTYGVDMKVIRNFPFAKKESEESSKNENIILYQGALNVGRGLEELITAMQYVNNGRLLIAGAGDVEDELKALVQSLEVDSKVEFLGRLSLLELFKATQKAKLGVSLEKDLGLNYRYAVPNKIFDYIQAGIPVLYSPLIEVVDLLGPYLIGETLISHDPKSMAKQIDSMLMSDKRELWEKECKRAAKEFNWENEEKKLITIFKNIE